MNLAALHIANLTDARYFSAHEMAWLGFSLDIGSAAYLSPDKLREIRAWVEGPLIFGELGAQSPEEVAELVRECALDGVVAGMFHDPADLSAIPGLRVVQELVWDPTATAEELLRRAQEAAPYVEAFLLDLSKNALRFEALRDSGLLEVLQALCRTHRVWVHADFPAHQLREAHETLGPYGWCVHGGSEIRTGIKSYDELDEWLEAAEEL